MNGKCSKSIYLKGGFKFTVRVSRNEYQCSECGKPIRKSSYYVEERKMSGVVYRYHPKCCERRYSHVLRVEDTPSQLVICKMRGDL